MSESPVSSSEGASLTGDMDAIVPLRVAGAWSGQVDVPLDTWTVSDLRLQLSRLSGFSPDSISLICAGKVLKDQASGILRKMGITHKSKILMTRVAGNQSSKAFLAEEERQARLTRIKAAADAIVKRSSSDAFSDDHYDLQLENQSGEALKFTSESDRRALMLGLMLHAKGRDMLLQDNYSEALEVLSMSEEAFGYCDSKLLEAVDNVALLQIDIVWCYFMLKDIARIADAGKRLSQARDGLRRSHGPNLERLRILQGGFCPELAIYVRLELLEGVVAFHTGLREVAKISMASAQSKYNQLQLSDESLALLVSMGFSTRDSQRALRVSGQDVNRAIEFLTEEKRKRYARREEDRLLKKQRRELKSYGMTQSGKMVDSSKLDELVAIGYAKLLAAEALRQSENDFGSALDILSNPTKNAELQSKLWRSRDKSHRQVNKESLEQLMAMGFPREQATQALLNASDVNEAVTSILQGTLLETNAIFDNMQNASTDGPGESSSNVHKTDGENSGPPVSLGDPRDIEMEDDIATKLTGDTLAEYDIDVRKEGEAIHAYLELLSSKNASS
ncbi:hypothetical protein KP509_06G044600 [Ceratopteris richardii]|uniref:NEDD8 ultimate buster 1 n=1 Tax=Ceratopteris richardii TaxID=49495 RepID=A0A8T2UNR9_CERRI|nr:hypothetical protein KP509_06G044600 [Ceratopteris richardii]